MTILRFRVRLFKISATGYVSSKINQYGGRKVHPIAAPPRGASAAEIAAAEKMEKILRDNIDNDTSRSIRTTVQRRFTLTGHCFGLVFS